jgi:hypothetical protein
VILDEITLGKRLEVLLELGDWNLEAVQIPLEPGQEEVTTAVDVVIAVQDATVVRNQKLGDCCNHTFAGEGPGSA